MTARLFGVLGVLLCATAALAGPPTEVVRFPSFGEIAVYGCT